MIHLQAAVPEDDDVMYEVYKSTRENEFAPLGMPAQQLDLLLKMQYDAQRRSYAAQYPGADRQMITDAESKIGYIITDTTSDSWDVLVYIAVLPEYRGRGIGTQLIKQLQQAASKREKRLRLQVASDNPARRLYTRLGFAETGAAPPYMFMEWGAGESTELGL